MQSTETKKGESAVLLQFVLGGLFPIIAILSYQTISPLTSLAVSSFIAAIFFLVIIFTKKSWNELRNRSIWKDLLLVVLSVGILYYGFFYLGLKYTTAANASLIALTEVFFSFLFFNVWKKEAISVQHISGAILMILGTLVVILPKFNYVNQGDLFILIASFIAPFGNYYQQKLRKKVSSSTLMFLRNILSLPFIVILIYMFGEIVAKEDIYKSFWFLFVNGVVVLGISKLLWLEAISRISVTKAIALLSVSPLFTMIFAYFILKQIPTALQVLAFLPLFIGLLLLTSENNYITKTRN